MGGSNYYLWKAQWQTKRASWHLSLIITCEVALAEVWFLLQMQTGPVEDWNQSRFTKTSKERIHSEWHMDAASHQTLCFVCSVSPLGQARPVIAQDYENTPVWVRAVHSPTERCSGLRWKKLRCGHDHAVANPAPFLCCTWCLRKTVDSDCVVVTIILTSLMPPLQIPISPTSLPSRI